MKDQHDRAESLPDIDPDRPAIEVADLSRDLYGYLSYTAQRGNLLAIRDNGKIAAILVNPEDYAEAIEQRAKASTRSLPDPVLCKLNEELWKE